MKRILPILLAFTSGFGLLNFVSAQNSASLGIFESQSDVGSVTPPGKLAYDPAARIYTIDSAGYNIWYQRDEFHYLWKKMDGDASLSASVTWPVG